MLRNIIKIILPIIAILSLGLLVGCESTHQDKSRDTGVSHRSGSDINKAKQRHKIVERLERFDKDHNGTVNISDVPKNARRIFNIIDTNNNGQLSEHEMERFEHQPRR